MRIALTLLVVCVSFYIASDKVCDWELDRAFRWIAFFFGIAAAVTFVWTFPSVV